MVYNHFKAAMTVVLETQHLTKRFGSLTAVDDLNLSVNAGEVFGFLGPNGAGKTTSISMMCGLLKPDTGRTTILGQPVQAGTGDWRVRLGVCPQNVVVWDNLTCLEQLQFMGEMYGLSSSKARKNGNELLQTLDLEARRNWQAGKLSGGMRRRLSLALALVHDPELVILDEPSAGLDPQSRLLVREYIRGLARQKTVILTTHDMDEAERVADRVAIIDHGKLMVLDTPEALKRSLHQGDVIEISLEHPPNNLATLVETLSETGEVRLDNSTLILRMQDGVRRLPGLLDSLSAIGVQPLDVRLRQTTLEDVFIQLTGRRLRE